MAYRHRLPRLVEQLRILLWLQMHFALLMVVATIFGLYLVDRFQTAAVFDTVRYHELDALEFRLGVATGLLLLAAILLAVGAKLLWRRWAWVHVLVVVAEAIVVTTIVLGLVSGLAAAVPAVLYAALTAWAVADLFRGEVLAYEWTRRHLSPL